MSTFRSNKLWILLAVLAITAIAVLLSLNSKYLSYRLSGKCDEYDVRKDEIINNSEMLKNALDCRRTNGIKLELDKLLEIQEIWMNRYDDEVDNTIFNYVAGFDFKAVAVDRIVEIDDVDHYFLEASCEGLHSDKYENELIFNTLVKIAMNLNNDKWKRARAIELIFCNNDEHEIIFYLRKILEQKDDDNVFWIFNYCEHRLKNDKKIIVISSIKNQIKDFLSSDEQRVRAFAGILLSQISKDKKLFKDLIDSLTNNENGTVGEFEKIIGIEIMLNLAEKKEKINIAERYITEIKSTQAKIALLNLIEKHSIDIGIAKYLKGINSLNMSELKEIIMHMLRMIVQE